MYIGFGDMVDVMMMDGGADWRGCGLGGRGGGGREGMGRERR